MNQDGWPTVTGFVLLYDTASSRSKSSSTRKVLFGAARVRIDNIDEDVCTVTYQAVAGPDYLVGRQDTYPRSAVFITPDERIKFRSMVKRFWGTPWRGQAGK